MADCCPEFPRVRVALGDGTFLDLPVIQNIITLPGAADETPFDAVEGCGIVITAGGPSGHQPVIGLNLDPDSPIPITCDPDTGRVRVGPGAAATPWTSPNTTPQGGIRVIAGGAIGHDPTFALALDPDSPFGISGGRLTWLGGDGFSCSDLAGCSINNLADVQITSPGPGDIICYDDTAAAFVNKPAGTTTTDPCTVPGGGITGTQVGQFTFACASLDLAGASDPETLFPAAGFPKKWVQDFENGVTGQSETWVVECDTQGVLQWHSWS